MSKKNKEKSVTTKLVNKKAGVTTTITTSPSLNEQDPQVKTFGQISQEQINDEPEVKTFGQTSQEETTQQGETNGHSSKQETFNTIEPDKITTFGNIQSDDSNNSCENFINNVFNSSDYVHFIMVKSIDGISLNVMALDISKVPAKNSNGSFMILSSLEVYETVKKIFLKVSESRNTDEKNIMILIDRSTKVSIFVNGNEDLLLSGKRINQY
jgi:hypothetical protein